MDKRNHSGVSIKEKLIELMKPSNFIKLVKVQQDELNIIKELKKKEKYNYYIEQLYEHYIVNNLPKTFLC